MQRGDEQRRALGEHERRQQAQGRSGAPSRSAAAEPALVCAGWGTEPPASAVAETVSPLLTLVRSTRAFGTVLPLTVTLPLAGGVRLAIEGAGGWGEILSGGGWNGRGFGRGVEASKGATGAGDLAAARGAHEATLEVRPSNLPARRLYEKYGFKVVGTRTRYYSDNNEDALIMTTPELEGRQMRTRIAALRDEIAARPEIELGEDGAPIGPDRDDAGMAPETGPQSTPGEGSPMDGPDIISPSRITRRQA